MLTGSLVPAVSGIACEQACTLTVASTVVLIPKTKAKAKGARARRRSARPPRRR